MTFSTPVDEMIIYLPYLFIISNSYLWQYDLDVSQTISGVELVNATNETNSQNFMMKWFFGDELTLYTEGGLYFFQFGFDFIYFLNETACYEGYDLVNASSCVKNVTYVYPQLNNANITTNSTITSTNLTNITTNSNNISMNLSNLINLTNSTIANLTNITNTI